MNPLIKQRVDEVCEKIDALQKRERAIVFAMVFAVVYAVVQWSLFDPMLKRHQNSDLRIENIQQQMRTLDQEKQLLSAVIAAGPNRAREKELSDLQKQLARLDGRLQASTVALIPPTLMPEVLQEVLAEVKGLRLMAFENRQAIPLIEAKAAAGGSSDIGAKQTQQAPSTDDDSKALYRHHFVLTLEGDYRSTLAFFKALEEKPWKLFWQELRYKVIKYPKAQIVLDVYTLSMQRDWIGM